jgi:hypothetical protein
MGTGGGDTAVTAPAAGSEGLGVRVSSCPKSRCSRRGSPTQTLSRLTTGRIAPLCLADAHRRHLLAHPRSYFLHLRHARRSHSRTG